MKSTRKELEAEALRIARELKSIERGHIADPHGMLAAARRLRKPLELAARMDGKAVKITLAIDDLVACEGIRDLSAVVLGLMKKARRDGPEASVALNN